jgi:hypothetical protein
VKPTVTLSKDGSSVVVPAPARALRSSLSAGQARGRTAGGETFVYGLGTERFEAELEFRSLTAAQKEALADFFANAADGMRELFTYTGPSGTAYQARFAEPSLVFVEYARDVWDCSTRLELASLLD